MNTMRSAAYDPETIDLLRSVLDDAWESLPVDQQASASKSLIAERILRAAANGERDPLRLRAAALTKGTGAWH